MQPELRGHARYCTLMLRLKVTFLKLEWSRDWRRFLYKTLYHETDYLSVTKWTTKSCKEPNKRKPATFWIKFGLPARFQWETPTTNRENERQNSAKYSLLLTLILLGRVMTVVRVFLRRINYSNSNLHATFHSTCGEASSEWQPTPLLSRPSSSTLIGWKTSIGHLHGHVMRMLILNILNLTFFFFYSPFLFLSCSIKLINTEINKYK